MNIGINPPRKDVFSGCINNPGPTGNYKMSSHLFNTEKKTRTKILYNENIS